MGATRLTAYLPYLELSNVLLLGISLCSVLVLALYRHCYACNLDYLLYWEYPRNELGCLNLSSKAFSFPLNHSFTCKNSSVTFIDRILVSELLSVWPYGLSSSRVYPEDL